MKIIYRNKEIYVDTEGEITLKELQQVVMEQQQHQNYYKLCDYKKEYYKANREKLLARSKQQYYTNKEKKLKAQATQDNDVMSK